MFYIENFFFSKFFFEINIYFIFLTVFFLLILLYFSNNKSYLIFSKNSIFLKIIKFFLITSLLISFLFFLISFFYYSNFIYQNYLIYFNSKTSFFYSPNLNFFDSFFIYNFFFFKWLKVDFSLDLFGMILLFLAYSVGFLSILALDNKLYWKNFKYYLSFNIFVLVVIFYVSVSNLIFFFLMYECLLLPSFLFVYFVSPSRRSIQASIYFVVWTQLGSFLVLCCLSYLISFYSIYNFYDLKFVKLSSFEQFFIYLFIFLGFGFKVPIWPFHYWLTKTHVEAPSGFSIYLSGFLVKSALYGFYKINSYLFYNFNTSIFVAICIFGVVDSSMKMWGQTDIKKLVAYGTIQEMNLIFLVFCWGDINCINAGILFSATHAFLSALMFFLVDCLYRRYHTRSLVEINGILHFTPNLAISIIIMTIFFAGLPGTLKYVVEFYIFSGFLEISPSSTFILMIIANAFGLIGFSKCWYNLVFGGRKDVFHAFPLDLTYKEIYTLFFSFFFLFFFTFFSYFLF